MAGVTITGGDVLIEDVVVDGLGDATEPAFSIASANPRVRLINCKALSGGGFYFTAGDGSSMVGCTAHNPDGYGFFVEGPTGGMQMIGCTVKNASISDTVAAVIIDGQGQSRDIVVKGCSIEGSVDGISAIDIDHLVLADNDVKAFSVGIDLTDVNGSTITGNNVAGFDGIDIELSEHGIVITDSSDNVVAGNVITEPGVGTDDTYDGIHLAGDSNRNHIAGNTVIPSTVANATRYGVNISAATCDDNVVADNVLGPTASYGTGAYNDAGTGTVTARDGNGQFTW